MIGFRHPDESRRDRLLRRLDWRFLLDDPHPSAVAAACTGLLREAIGLISTTPVVEPGQAGSATLVALSQPGPAALRAAHATLRDGGSLYAEWRGASALRRTRLLRWLLESGFENIRFYAVRPDPEVASAAAWVPLDDDAAVAFFLSSRSPHRRAYGRLAQRVRHLAWGAGERFRISVPLCVTASRKRPQRDGDSTRGAAGEGTLPQRLAEELASAVTGRARSGSGSPGFVLLTPGRSALNKIIFVAVGPGSPEPQAVIKLPRSEDALASLRREAAALRELSALEPPLEGVPRFTFFDDDGGVARLAQGVVRGTTIEPVIAGPGLHQLLASATAWLAELARRTRTERNGGALHEYVDQCIGAFVSNYGTAVDGARIATLRAALRSIGDLPAVREHRDFSPWNVLRDSDGRLGVLDWESSIPQGLPWLDLIYFLTYCGFYRHRADEPDSFSAAYRALWSGDSEISGAVESSVAGYSAAADVSPRAIASLRVLTWVIHSASEHRRMCMVAGPSPAPEMLRQSLFLRLVLDELDLSFSAGAAR
jgi:hypothetical protein